MFWSFALSGVPVVDLQWLVQSGVEAFLNMPPSALFPVPAEVSAQTFFNASRNFLWRLGFATISKSDARMLLNSARLWAKVNNANFAAVPVVEPEWSADMEAAEMDELAAAVPPPRRTPLRRRRSWRPGTPLRRPTSWRPGTPMRRPTRRWRPG